MDELILSGAAVAKATGENSGTTFHEPEKIGAIVFSSRPASMVGASQHPCWDDYPTDIPGGRCAGPLPH
jgi:hypothetical protein